MKLKSQVNLTAALTDRDEIIESAFSGEFDDEQLRRIKNFNQLEVWEKDLFVLRAKYKVKEVAQLYNVTPCYISSLLKEIYQKLL